MMSKVFIDEIEYVKKKNDNVNVPENKIGATHWAVLPDESIVFYKITSKVLMWFPLSKVWDDPKTTPYTLHSFDDYIT